MAGLIRHQGGFAAILVVLGATGCGCNGGNSVPPETQASKDASNAEAAKWTPEMKQKFMDEMKGHALTARGPSQDALGKK